MNIRIWKWKLCLVWGKIILSTVSTRLVCVNWGWLCLPSVNSLGQGSGFVEWANCFPLCCPSCKCPSGLYQTVFTASKCCLPLPCTLGLCAADSRASKARAGPHSLELLSEGWWCRAWTGLIPIGVVCRSRNPASFPVPEAYNNGRWFRLPLGHGMLLFLFSSGFLCGKAHFSFFDSSKIYQVQP